MRACTVDACTSRKQASDTCTCVCTVSVPDAQALSAFGDDIAIAFSGAEDVALIEYAHLTGRPYRVFRWVRRERGGGIEGGDGWHRAGGWRGTEDGVRGWGGMSFQRLGASTVRGLDVDRVARVVWARLSTPARRPSSLLAAGVLTFGVCVGIAAWTRGV